MRAPILALCLALPGLAAASSFDHAASRAERIPSLRAFLEGYVGSCDGGDPVEKRDCLKRTESERRTRNGHRYVATVDAARNVTLAGCDNGSCRLLLVPFFDGGGYGLSRGVPRRDRSGSLLVDRMALEAHLDEEGVERLQRAVRTGMLEAELVFEPTGSWRLPEMGGGAAEGASVKLHAVRLKDGRTGETLAETD